MYSATPPYGYTEMPSEPKVSLTSELNFAPSANNATPSGDTTAKDITTGQ